MTERAELSRTNVSRAGEKWPFSMRLMVLRSTPANCARAAWLRSCFARRVKSRSASSFRMLCTSRLSEVSLGFDGVLADDFVTDFVIFQIVVNKTFKLVAESISHTKIRFDWWRELFRN